MFFFSYPIPSNSYQKWPTKLFIEWTSSRICPAETQEVVVWFLHLSLKSGALVWKTKKKKRNRTQKTTQKTNFKTKQRKTTQKNKQSKTHFPVWSQALFRSDPFLPTSENRSKRRPWWQCDLPALPPLKRWVTKFCHQVMKSKSFSWKVS